MKTTIIVVFALSLGLSFGCSSGNAAQQTSVDAVQDTIDTYSAVNGTDSEAFKTERLLPFPWEKSKKKAEAPKVSAEEARKRFERLVGQR